MHKLTQPKAGEIHVQPALSRDGKLLAFTVDRDGVSTISFVKLQGRDDAGRRDAGAAISAAGKHRFAATPSGVRMPVNSCSLHNKGALLSWLWSVKVDANGRAASPRLIGNLGEGAYMLAVSPERKTPGFHQAHVQREPESAGPV